MHAATVRGHELIGVVVLILALTGGTAWGVERAAAGIAASPAAAGSAWEGTASAGAPGDATEELVVFPPDWRDAYPFSVRYADTAGAEHVIDLATVRFATDWLVSVDSSGAKRFDEPDLSSFEESRIRAAFAAAERDLFIVQASDPESQSALRRWLESAGIPILGYIPHDAYLLRLDAPTLARVSAQEAVYWIGLFQPAYRVAPDLDFIRDADPGHLLKLRLRLDFETYPTRREVLAMLRTVPEATVVDVARTSRDWIVRADGPVELAHTFAGLPGCRWVERFVSFQLDNNIARTSTSVATGRGAASGPILDVEDVWARGIRGEGQIASAADTGLSTGNLATPDSLHFDFGQTGSATNPMRVIAGYALGRATWDDNQTTGGGHGTHTSGSIVGNGIRSGSTPSSNTFPTTAFAGTAPKAQFVFQSVMDSGGALGGLPADMNTLFQQTYDDGARVHSNSWGAPVAGQYTTDSENVDQFAWDHKDMVITFSAGNDGADPAAGDGVINTDSIGAPGTAKNCITVGASENYRPDFIYEFPEADCTGTAFTQAAWGWFNGTNFPAAPINADLMANNANGMGAFSSRGPTDDTRFKPDITAPGIAIISTRTNMNQAYEQWGICNVPVAQRPYYVNMGGTSMSNPLTAGAATLVRQYYVDGWHANNSATTNATPVLAQGFNPTSALVKATLINGAWEMAPGQYGSSAPQPEIPPSWDRTASRDLPNNAEGYGRLDLESALFPGAGWGDNASRSMQVRDVASGIGTGARNSYAYSVGSSADPLIVTLAWTDPFATAGAGTKLVNNLDLEVTSPSGRRYTTNRVDTYVTSPTAFVRDSRNNVEQVKVTAPETGAWTVDVVGTSVPGNGGGGTTSQPFALVLSAISCVAPAAPTGASAMANGNNRIDVSWNSVAGAGEYRVYRGMASGAATTLVATVTAPATTYMDTAVLGGITYYYVVTSASGSPACESALSGEVFATATGACTLAPTFAGLVSVAASGSSACGLDLTWAAASAPCGGAVSYSIYRSTASGFTPALANRIAAAWTGTTYTDSSALTGGTTYYYVVRAADDGNGVQDTNTVQRSGAPLGGAVTVINEAFTTGNPPTGWSVVNAGTGTQTWTTTNPGSRGIPSGMTSPIEIIDSDFDGPGRTQDDSLVTPAFSASGATAVALELDTYYNDYDASDSAAIDVSANGGSSWSNRSTWTADVGSAATASHQTFDITTLAAGSANVKVRFHYVGTYGWYWLVDNVRVQVTGSCTSAPQPVQYFTARATSATSLLEWQNPAAGSYGSAVVRVRTDSTFPTSAIDGTGVTCVGQNTALGAYNSCTHAGVNGTTYSYSLFVDNGAGVTSARRTVAATPFDTTGARKWAYSTGASSLAPAGILPGAIGSGGVFDLSNDRVLHAMEPTDAGGSWPRTGSFSWSPQAMNAPAQHRPPVVPLAAGPRVFLASQDGYAYSIDATTGIPAWTSAKLGDVLQAGPAGLFSDLNPAAPDLVFVGTRNATSANTLFALDPATGATMTQFDNGGGATAIGIITGISVDYATNYVYFTSRAAGGGSSDTVWCLDATGGTLSKVWSLAVGDIDGSPVLHQGRLYVGTNTGLVRAIDVATQAEAWTYTSSPADGPVKGYVFPHFSSSPLRLYFTSTNRVWAIVDNGSSASLAWSVTTVSNPSTPLLVIGTTHLLVGGGNGTLYQLATADGAVTGSVNLGSSALGGPARDSFNNRIHVGSTAGVLHTVTIPLP